jgi:hypothetical protein
MAALFLSPVLLAGCQATVVQEPPAPMQKRPIVIDDAMRHRDWSTSVATIETGATIAGPTLFAFEPADRMDPPLDSSYFEVGIFLGNIACLPIVSIFDPPWTPTVYRGVNLPPSYTMSPAYPEETPPPASEIYAHRHKAGAEADAPAARHYRKNASTRPVF